jgi:[1-hydroxy-2-(trimethylamino)ethyl]phosphonate dioxygenase
MSTTDPGRRANQVASSVSEVLALYERWGSDHYDEDLSQLDHALQTAEHAIAAGAANSLIAAALLHDVGHLLELDARSPAAASSMSTPSSDGEDLAHEDVGARFLARIFPPSITAPIALHVRAKRYLCAVEPAYASGLSLGSRASLELQGGPMAVEEAVGFERMPAAADAIALRRWDDAGKVLGAETAPLERYRALLDHVTVSRIPDGR